MPHLSPLTSHFSPRPAAWLHNPALSIWLSVDPLSDKYPGVSPYVYCGNNPVMMKDPDGAYGVLVLHQEQSKDIVWRGKVRCQMHLPATAILRMTYYYSVGTTAGSLSDKQISYVKDNITGNLNSLVGQPISVKGNSYYFSYNIDYVAVQNATEKQLQAKSENTKYRNLMVGNYIWSGITEAEKQQAKVEDAYGVASDNYMKFDFPKIFAHAEYGQYDGQTAIHELLHNIGAEDIPDYGSGIMDWPDYRDPCNPKPRSLKMNEMECIINDPHYQNRIHAINENEY